MPAPRLRNILPFALCLLTATAVQAEPGRKVYEQGGADPAAIACITCHGEDAFGMAAAGFPRLAGQSAAYLSKQLADFKSGSRSNPVMQPIASALDADEIVAVTTMLAAMPAPQTRRSKRADLVDSLGAQIALRGAWERNIPECVACHGPGGVGVGDHFPPLAGQSAEYLSAELNAWRSGLRNNDPNQLMGHIARSLTDEEISAVTAYFAGLGESSASSELSE